MEVEVETNSKWSSLVGKSKAFKQSKDIRKMCCSMIIQHF